MTDFPARCTRRRILVVSTNADQAGAPSHVRDLVNALGHRYQFMVAFGEAGPIEQVLSRAGVQTCIVEGLRSSISPVRDLDVIKRVRAIIRDFDPCLIHAHSSKAGLIARLAGRLERVPVIYTVHGWGFGAGRPALQSAIVRVVEQVLQPFTRMYIAVSEADGQVGRVALGLGNERLQVVPNGVPDTHWRAQPDRNGDFVMVARTDAAKDHPTALRAFAALPSGSRFSCVGGGTDSDAFGSLVMDRGAAVAARVRQLGARSDVAEILASHGVFVLASRYEGMPLSIIEAMRAGLPVIASRVGGVGELVVDEVTGYLVPPGDVDALSRAMRTLAEDPALRLSLGTAGRNRYERLFSIDRMQGAVDAAYRTVLGVPA